MLCSTLNSLYYVMVVLFMNGTSCRRVVAANIRTATAINVVGDPVSSSGFMERRSVPLRLPGVVRSAPNAHCWLSGYNLCSYRKVDLRIRRPSLWKLPCRGQPAAPRKVPDKCRSDLPTALLAAIEDYDTRRQKLCLEQEQMSYCHNARTHIDANLHQS